MRKISVVMVLLVMAFFFCGTMLFAGGDQE